MTRPVSRPTRRLSGRCRDGLLRLLALFCFVAAPGPLLAQPAPADQLLPNSLAPVETQTRAMTVEQATRLVRKRTGGRVLAAEPTFRRGVPGVSVRVLIEGARVVTLFVDDEGRIRGR